METNLIGIEHATENVFTAPQGPKDFRAWKGSMQKEADFRHWNTPRQVGRKDQQMESVNPHKVALVEALDHHLRKLAVHGVIGRPILSFSTATSVDWTLLDIVCAVRGKLAGIMRLRIIRHVLFLWTLVLGVNGRHVMQNGPENALAETIVPNVIFEIVNNEARCDKVQ